jgi:hypothetical protein
MQHPLKYHPTPIASPRALSTTEHGFTGESTGYFSQALAGLVQWGGAVDFEWLKLVTRLVDAVNQESPWRGVGLWARAVVVATKNMRHDSSLYMAITPRCYWVV